MGNLYGKTNIQNNLEKEEWIWRYHDPYLKIILQNYNTQCSMVLEPKHTHKLMKQSREPRNKPTHLWFHKGVKNVQWRKGNLFFKWYWGNRTATCKWTKLEHFPTSHTKISSKIDERPKYKPRKHKSLRRTCRQNILDINCSNIFLSVF